ncbi:DUF4194 domain-containing protein [Ralstonia solanacearum]|uniref:DUF4194 domain-containing protein n=1 Tax=Ralstonia pseudosolanacearum TaxID=1310165 RepID=UPI0009BD7A7E
MDPAEQEAPLDETSTAAQPAVPELSILLVHMLKGVLYREDDERLWASLLRLQARVREQAAVLLLDLVLDEAEGYAFLRARLKIPRRCGVKAGCGKKKIESVRRSWLGRPSVTRAT